MKARSKILKKHSGRGSTGRVTVRHQGGRRKRFYRTIDFKRDKKDIPGQVISSEYDPNRGADIALISYPDGQKRYILAPLELKIGDLVISSEVAEPVVGNSMPLGKIPVGTVVHNIEIAPGSGGKLARGAGVGATVLAKEENFVHIKMPSGEVRKINSSALATIGRIGNVQIKDRKLKKAGDSRHMGIRPTVRGVAQNPRSHPHGGGEGRSGIGMPAPKTYKGKIAVGKTRKKQKYSNSLIISRRKR